jgi:ribonuclease VapC
MTIDSSALIAILRNEPECDRFLERIDADPVRIIAAPTVLEASMVLEGRFGENAGMELDLFLHRASARVVAFDDEHLRLARSAHRRFGKGRHPAGLNFGDCTSYALAQWSGEPLLAKGNDFRLTDVTLVR